jgi:cell division protein FtsQ
MKTWKQKISMYLWVFLGAGLIVLMMVAMRKKDQALCKGVVVRSETAEENTFVSRAEILQILQEKGIRTNQSLEHINLYEVENTLEENPWFSDVQLYLDENRILQVVMTERKPIARIFTSQGASFYIDSSGHRMPLSDARTARLPVFTSFPSSGKRLSAADSIVLKEIKRLASFIASDSFWSSQVAQINITPTGTYEMAMTVGNQVVVLGNIQELEQKFHKLKEFMRQVWPVAGIEKYERIDVQYKDQVVAVRRGAVIPSADTAHAMLQVSAAANKMHAIMKDSLYASDVNKTIKPTK